MELMIRTLQSGDLKQLNTLFEASIGGAFASNGTEDASGMANEVEAQLDTAKQFLSGEDDTLFYLVGVADGQVVGTIAYHSLSDSITENLKQPLNVPEIGCVYVLPSYQKRGVGTILFNSILTCLVHKGITEFCLDSGYRLAQKFWSNRLGEPKHIIKDYWGEGSDQMIWHCKIDAVGIKYLLG